MSAKIGKICAALIVGIILSIPAISAVQAEDWKPKKITAVLAHSLGGGQDRASRALADVWAKHQGTKIEVLPKGGASGRIGFDYFLAQPKDGTFVLSTNISTTGTMYAQQKPDWKWADSVDYLGTISVDPGVVFVLNDSPLKSMADVIAMGKKERAIFAISSWASTENLALHQMMKQTGTKYEIIPIGGGSDLVTAVLGGHVPVAYGKASNVSKASDRVRVLAVGLQTNPIKDMTSNAPTFDEATGTKTLSVASYRTILIPASLRKDHPDRYKKLKESFEAAKDDPEFIAAAKKAGIAADLIIDMEAEQLTELLEGVWTTYYEHGAFFGEKPKVTTVTAPILKLQKKGRYVSYKGPDGKEARIRVHREDSGLTIDGKDEPGKAGQKKLKVGMSCTFTYVGVPVKAKSADCKS